MFMSGMKLNFSHDFVYSHIQTPPPPQTSFFTKLITASGIRDKMEKATLKQTPHN